MQSSDKSISEIVATSTEEPEDLELESVAEVIVEAPENVASTNALSYISLDSAEYYPTIQKAREEAQIPEHISVKNLVDRRILIAHKVAQKAALPDTGELRDGWFCSCLDLETKKPFTTWFGQIALVRDLGQLQTPFQATIVKHGRTYRFE
jgi:hypothetical protein